jgi:hypothetical protein
MIRRKPRGQNLIEFTLVAPILIMVLVVISELGYAFVVRHTIIDSIKQTVQSAQFRVGKHSSEAEMLAAMKQDMQGFIKTHNLPDPISLEFGVVGQSQYGTVLVVSYVYKPGFRLIGITPERIAIQSTQVVQPAFIKPNNPTVPYVPSL